MADYLNTLYLFGDVKITRDYSTVHDLSPSDWLTYLKGTITPIWTDAVNYYRLPSVIRVEGNYDTLRKVTYGALEGTEAFTDNTFDRPVFFWVDGVRLVKQASYIDSGTVSDVVELTISEDIWSSNNGEFTLHDSWIVRRTCQRWNVRTVGGVKIVTPRYYPEGADQVVGAYNIEGSPQKITVSYKDGNDSYDCRYIIVTSVDKDGKLTWRIGAELVDYQGQTIDIYDSASATYFGVDDILDGTAFAAFHSADNSFSVEDVQSITVLPYLGPLTDIIEKSGTKYQFDQADVRFFHFFSGGNYGNVSWLTVDGFDTIGELKTSIYASDSASVSPVEPSWTDITGPGTAQYTDLREPMLYYGPARVRKVVSGMGGTVIDVPDIAAFENVWSCQNLLDVGATATAVYADADIMNANAIGAVGMVTNATLPIYSDAWKSYEATSKIADTISHNAQQAATVANGLAGAAASGGMGALAGGGPAGAVLGAATALAGMGASLYSNTESLRAKRTQIKNSPAIVKNTGSGLGAAVCDFIDIYYETLKIDDITYENLRRQYYYYGYNINAFEPGTVDTHVRYLFDYIETKDAKITGNLNASEAAAIQDIFNRGVRIYHGTVGYGSITDGMVLENYDLAANE